MHQLGFSRSRRQGAFELDLKRLAEAQVQASKLGEVLKARRQPENIVTRHVQPLQLGQSASQAVVCQKFPDDAFLGSQQHEGIGKDACSTTITVQQAFGRESETSCLCKSSTSARTGFLESALTFKCCSRH